MKFKCPFCQRECDFQDIQADSDMVAIFKMIPVFEKYFTQVWAYIQLFNATPLRWKSKKLRILITEMRDLYMQGQFSYKKRLYRISSAGITRALDIVIHRNFDNPLDNHNYLKKVMIAISEEEGKASSIHKERDLRKKEDVLRSQGTDAVSREENLKQVGDILKTFGGR